MFKFKPNEIDEAFEKLITIQDLDAIYLMGFRNDNNKMEMDAGIIADAKNNDLTDRVLQIVQMKIDLEPNWELRSPMYGGRFFDQTSSGSRKVVLPAVQFAVNSAILEYVKLHSSFIL